MSVPVTIEALNDFFTTIFNRYDAPFPEILVFEPDRTELRLEVNPKMIRPGGFISGPTQMALADHAAYVAIFTRLGITPMALTSNLNIDFLRPCTGIALIAKAHLVKIGRSLAVINVDILGEDSDKISSQAVVTYALPKPGLKPTK